MLCSFYFPKDGYPQRLKAACETVTIRIAFFKHIALKKKKCLAATIHPTAVKADGILTISSFI